MDVASAFSRVFTDLPLTVDWKASVRGSCGSDRERDCVLTQLWQ